MINQEIIEYVRSQSNKGFSQQDIRNALTSSGWKDSDIEKAFMVLEPGNKIWSVYIFWVNRITLSLSFFAVFIFDLWFIFFGGDNMEEIYLIFWAIMLVVLWTFYSTYSHENKVLSPKFEKTKSSKDLWILFVISVRNVVFMLNFIPYIQVYGLIALLYGIIPYTIVYQLLLKARSKEV